MHHYGSFLVVFRMLRFLCFLLFKVQVPCLLKIFRKSWLLSIVLSRNGSLSVPDLLSSRQMIVDLSLSSMKGVILVVVVNNSVIYASKPFCSMVFVEVMGVL